ncbi:MAG: carbohydrate ABC transporter permease [Spirochaetaceae bacterium]|nr:carbohydrate ABC transporter permease [Spirochaetaceae bacterium]
MVEKNRALNAAKYVFAIAVAVGVLAPFAWMFVTSVGSARDLAAAPPRLAPSEWNLDRYRAIFTSASKTDVAYAFRVAMGNSLVVAGAVTLAALVAGGLAAYSFARLEFRGRRPLLLFMLFTYMAPPVVFVIPLYALFEKLGWLNSRSALVLLYSSFVIPFIVWVMRGFFASISRSYEDAAAMDGCTRLQALWHVFLPMARPGFIATGILAFLMSWDEFFMALVFTSNLKAKTISVAIAEFNGKFSIDYGMISAGGVLASLPPVIIALAFQKYIVMGMTSGGVKE